MSKIGLRIKRIYAPDKRFKADRRMEGQIDGRTNGRTDGRTNGQSRTLIMYMLGHLLNRDAFS